MSRSQSLGGFGFSTPVRRLGHGKSRGAGRRLRMESLEDRQLLAVVSALPQPDHIDLTFDQPVDLSTFTPEDVSILPQSGVALQWVGQVSSSASAVAAKGELAYVGGNYQLQVYNVADPAAPSLVGSCPLSSYQPLTMSVVGDLAYLGEQWSGVEIFNIADATAPSLVGSFATATDVAGISVVGDLAYLAARYDGLLIYNVANPAAPSLVASYSTSGDSWGISVVGDLAYLANGYTVDILNVADPAAPSLVGSYSVQSWAGEITVVGNLAYVGDGGSMDILDVANPAAPTLLGSCQTCSNALGNGLGTSIRVVGDLAYVGNAYAGVKVVSVTDPTAPSLVGSYPATGYPMNISVVGDQVYVADGVFHILHNRAAVTSISQIGEATYRLQLADILPGGSYTLTVGPQIADSSGALMDQDQDGVPGEFPSDAFRMSWEAPNTPPIGLSLSSSQVAQNLPPGTVVGRFSTTDPDAGDTFTYSLVAGEGDVDNGSFTIDASGNLLTAAMFDLATKSSYSIRVRTTDAGGLGYEKAFTITVVAPPQVVSATPQADYLDVTFSKPLDPSTFTLDDVSILPASGVVLESLGYVNNANAAVVKGELAYVGGSNFQIYNVADPAAPSLLGSFQTMSNQITKVLVVGDLAYVGESWSGVEIVNIADPTAPSRVASFAGGSGVTGLSVVGDLAYLTTPYNGLLIYNIADPASPSLVTGYSTSYQYQDISVVGDLAYLTNGPTVDILNVANPAAPSLVGSHSVQNQAVGLTVVGDLLYVANGSGVEILDVTNPAAPNLVGSYQTSGYVTEVTVVGDLAYLANVSGSMEILNVADSAAPSLVATYPMSGHVSVVGDRIYVARGRLEILHNPAAVRSISQIGEATYRLQLAGTLPGGSYTLTVGPQITDSSGVLMDQDQDGVPGEFPSDAFRMSLQGANTSPTELSLSSSQVAQNLPPGTVVGRFSTTDPDAGDTFTYSLVSGDGDVDNGSFTIDASGNLLTAATFDLTTKSSYSIRVRTTDAGGLGYEKAFVITVVAPPQVVSATPQADYLDVTFSKSLDPSTFTLEDVSILPASGVALESVGQVSCSASDVAVVGGLAYVGGSNFQIYNVADPASPSLLGSYQTYGQVTEICMVGNLAYLAEQNGGLEIVDITDPTAPSRVGGIAQGLTISGISVLGDLAYLKAQFYGLVVLNVANPAAPRFVASYPTPNATTQLTAVGDLVYVANGSSVDILNVANPAAPSLLGSYPVLGYATQVTVVGNLAYVAAGNTVDIVDVANPAAPSLVGRYWTQQNSAVGLSVVGSLLYVADNSGVEILNIADPAAPTLVGYYSMPGYAMNVSVAGDRVYVAEGSDLQILRNPVAISSISQIGEATYRLQLASPLPTTRYTLTVGPQIADSSGLLMDQDQDGVSGEFPDDVFRMTWGTQDFPPIWLGLSSSQVAENVPLGTVVGSFSTLDPDAGDTFTYSLIPGKGAIDNGSFAMDADGNLLTAASFNFETQSSYSIRVRTTDAAGLWCEQMFTIQVTDVNEVPTDMSLSVSHVAEHLPRGMVVGSFHAIDPDQGDTFTYALVPSEGDPDNAAFTIDTNGRLRTAASFDYATKNSYSIRVRATDAGELAYEKDFTITITQIPADWQPLTVVSTAPQADHIDITFSKPVDLATFTPEDVSILPESGVALQSLGQIPSNFEDVAVVGDYAYATTSQGLSILDISNAGQPRLVGSYALPQMGAGMVVVDNLLYVADGSSLQILSIANPTVPSLVGSCSGFSFALDVTVVGNWAYLADEGQGGGLQIINVADPTAPTLVGSYQTASYAHAVSVTGDLAYVADYDDGLLILDVADPTAPALVGSYDTPGIALGVTVVGNLAYVADAANGVQILNVADPTAPSLVATRPTSNWAWTVNVVGNLTYVADTTCVEIFNVTDPAAPSFVGRYQTPGAIERLNLVGDLVYTANIYGGMQILDVADPSLPSRVGSYDTPYSPRTVRVVDDLAYVGGTNFQIYNMADPSVPRLLGSYPTHNQVTQLTVVGDLAYVAEWYGGVEIVNIADPTAPTWVADCAAWTNVTSVCVVGNLAYLTIQDGGLMIFDVTNPAAPGLVTTYGTPSNALDVTGAGNLAYVAYGSGIDILDVTNPTAPSLMGRYLTSGYARTVTVVGNLAYVAAGDRVEILDVSDPAALGLVGSCLMPNGASDMSIVGGLAYVVSDRGVWILDIADPAAPSLVGSYDTPGYPMEVSIVGDRVYVADYQDLQILRNPAAVSSISQVGAATYRLQLASSLPNGNYTLSIGSQVADSTGLLMDQDQDTIPGESPDDVFREISWIGNDAPTQLNLSSNQVAENLPLGAIVGGLNTTDPDAGDTFTYSLVSGEGDADNGSFAIDTSGNLLTAASFDFEAKDSYSIRVRTTDVGGLSYEQVFTIQVTNVNETPTALSLSASQVAENLPPGTLVGSFSTTDPDAGDTFAYSLISGEGDTDNGSFTIDAGGNLLTATSFDFEAKDSFSIRVRTTDATGLSYEQVLTIQVTNVNETPTALRLAASQVAENLPRETVVGSFSTTDPDAGDTFTYSLISGEGDADNGSFTIDAGGNLLTATSFDFEAKNSYSIRVRTTDAAGLSYEQTFAIAVTDGYDVPTPHLTGASSVDEGSSYLLNLAAGNIGVQTIGSWLITWGDGSVETVLGNPASVTHIYAEGAANWSISATATDAVGTYAADNQLMVNVANLAPTSAAISGPTDGYQGVSGQQRTFSLSATDPSPVDQAALFTYTVHWGDGSATQSISGPVGVAVTHTFASVGTYQVWITATDKDGAESPASAMLPVTIASFERQGDSVVVGGTSGNDTVVLTQGLGSGEMALTLNGVSLGTLPAVELTGVLRIFGQGGTDTVTLNGRATDDLVGINGATITVNETAVVGDNIETWQIHGLGGNDTFTLLAGVATIDGGSGTDTLVGSNAANIWNLTGIAQGTLNNGLPFVAVENLTGGAASDSFLFQEAASGFGTVQGGGGTDTLNYSASTSAVSINLQARTASKLSGFASIEALVGSASTNDRLTGSNQVTTWAINSANGGTANAISFASFENLVGGAAADIFQLTGAGRVDRSLNGGAGTNVLDYSFYGTPGVTVDLLHGSATAVANRTAGRLAGFNIVVGTSGADTLTGDANGNVLIGGAGNDLLQGGAGRDLLIGGSGADELHGGYGEDILIGGLCTYYNETSKSLDLTAISAIMAEWKRTDLTSPDGTGYSARRDHLLTSSGGLNGSYLLNSSTVQRDASAVDRLYGDQDRDWFLASSEDRISNRTTSGKQVETLTRI